jgi:hypothetical protein
MFTAVIGRVEDIRLAVGSPAGENIYLNTF